MNTILTNSAAVTPSAPGVQTAPARPAAARLVFIDNIRWVMIMLVLSMHAAVTYSGHGGWYVKEPAKLGFAQEFTFVTYQVFLQSFFMGFLFFLAGYFVPRAFDKKGALHFVRDRAYRLGLPSLLFMLVIQPLTCYYVAGVWNTEEGFFGAYGHYLLSGRVLSGSGPLWFCVALLFFNCVYAVWRVVIRPTERSAKVKPFPRSAAIAAFIGVIAVCTFLVRIPWPNGTSFYNMQFCYFSQYVAFFIAGTLAYRQGWLSALPATLSRRWGLTGLLGGLVLWLLLIALGGATKTTVPYDGGWHWQSLGMGLLESLAGTGISLGLLGLFRLHFNRQGRWAKFFSDNAFAVYVFHTPILIAITLGMTGLHWLPLGKFVLATVLCIAASYALCAGVFRRIPGLKKIL
ncbi:MAG TPA: acyltransferase family protein [Puia sp.]|nr:acyltransferase family protein [Puia sp.]